MILNLATILTISRILFIPIVIFCYTYSNGELRNISAFIFLLALITDYFDGLVARKFNQETAFGAFLDPIADKLLVVVTILLLSRTFDSVLFLIPSLIIVSREFLVIAIRQRLAEIKSSVPMRVNTLGKVKTASQMIALFFLLHPDMLISFINLHTIGLLLLFVASVLTVISFIYYVRNSWDDILR
jgi:CDP-diacylglycerol--glycerol-3-phosphate 3-phosphatidyltransferase